MSSSDPHRSLEDRLNALKSAIPRPPPLDPTNLPLSATEQDRLSSRLRALREGSPAPGPESPPADGPAKAPALSGAAQTSGPEPAVSEQLEHPTKVSEAPDHPSQSSPKPSVGHDAESKPKTSAGEDGADDDDTLFLDDDQALEDFIDGLELDLDDIDEPTEPVAAGSNPSAPSGETNNDISRRMAALLDSMKSKPVPSARRPSAALGKDDEESDAETTSDVEDVMAQAMDELSLDRTLPSVESRPARPPSHSDATGDTEDDSHRAALLDIPDVPSSYHLPSIPSSLPNIPSSLPSPPSTSTDLSARLAALNVGGTPDSLSLPSVPTFNPNTPSWKRSGPFATAGFTDEDVTTWCIVCNADATVQCVGCDDDLYCDGCWVAMHVGPAAAFDAGHRRMIFNKRQRRPPALVPA